ncbi:NRT1-3 protein [Hibiscus syriacus]|uniref:NRT1-3 protein n=1 Tax=Hibiscus syriacus TaxID=106335 RepID=A0A6A3AKY6_HIBSY|nr:heavy metal-associated isoprenylated plant protein 12-like [Hibiscus syriacus]KAE8704698.1 NRT1-3 protein [Hibiscus syriacus]
MKKVVLKLDFHDEKCRQKVMKTTSGTSGVESVAMDKDQKLTVTGDIDPFSVVRKLRKLCHAEIVVRRKSRRRRKKSRKRL